LKRIFKINVKNWAEYNKGHRKSYTKLLIPHNFCSDAKLRAMPVTHRWLFLGIILTCGDHASDTIEMSEKQLRDLLESSKSVQSAMDLLQSLQLLAFEVSNPALYIKEKRSKEKRREEKLPGPGNSVAQLALVDGLADDPGKPESPPKKSKPKGFTNSTWEAYASAYWNRYNDEPRRSQAVNGQLASFIGKVGAEDAPSIAAFYVHHSDQLYVRSMHPLTLLVRDSQRIATEWKTGDLMTATRARQVETSSANNQVFDKLRAEMGVPIGK
jgi:hypothetical protein